MKNLKTNKIYLAATLLVVLALASMGVVSMVEQGRREAAQARADSIARRVALADSTARARFVADSLRRVRTLAVDSIRGTLTDSTGTPMPGVVVSDSYECTLTDSMGRYALRRKPKARFVYYTVPADCRVPTHSDADRTACCYRPIVEGDSVYDFTLTRLPGGKETAYRMIVIGDPQVTNAFSPYYTGPDDNPVKKSDVARFTDETMADIRQTLAELPPGTPVYGLSMGDDVQYYGSYNASLERQIRTALGSADMTVFSVIGNHDQDGKRVYKQKWEENWGPTDYSFDRGEEHYVCFNDCNFYHGSLYYQPGEALRRADGVAAAGPGAGRQAQKGGALLPHPPHLGQPACRGGAAAGHRDGAGPLLLVAPRGAVAAGRRLRGRRGTLLRAHPLRPQPRD